jgi:glycerophosphoryl diester phosphodiesterase
MRLSLGRGEAMTTNSYNIQFLISKTHNGEDIESLYYVRYSTDRPFDFPAFIANHEIPDWALNPKNGDVCTHARIGLGGEWVTILKP